MEVSGSDIENGCGNGERHEEEKQKPGGEASTEERSLRLFLRGSRAFLKQLSDGMKKKYENKSWPKQMPAIIADES